MKKIKLLVLCLFAFCMLRAQDDTNTKVRELGVYSSSLTSGYGITCKFGTPDLLWVVRGSFTGSIPFNKDSVTYQQFGMPQTIYINSSTNLLLGLTFGFEKYHTIKEKLFAYYGAVLSYSYQYIQNKDLLFYKNSTITNTPGIGIRFGLKYAISKHFNVAVDITPTFTYSNTKYSYNENPTLPAQSYSYSYNISSLNFSLFNTAVFTLTYRF